MKICAVSPLPPTVAGIADYGEILLEEFTRDPRVDDLIVLADRVAGAPEREHLGRIDILRVWERDRLGVGPTLARLISGIRPDLVWFNLGLTMFGTQTLAMASGLLAPVLTRSLGYRTVVTLHEIPTLADLAGLGIHPSRRLGASLALRPLLRASEVVVTLERYRDHLARYEDAPDVRHIPLPTSGEPEWLPEPDEETALVFGTFGPHKDPGLVLEAVADLRRSRPGLRLVVAGADHPRHPGFMARFRSRHFLDGSWLGYVRREELARLFARTTVVVIPSRASTGSSSVIHRAIGHGRAVLASDLPDFRALAAEEHLELSWFDPGDPRALAEALGALLDDREGRNAQVVRNLAAVARLTPARIATSYVDLFAGHRT